MKYHDKIDSIITVAVEQKRITNDQQEKLAFAKSIFADLLTKTDKWSVKEIRAKGEKGKIGWTEVTPEMLTGLIALRETLEANPQLRKTRRRRTRNVVELMQKHRAELDLLYESLLSDTPARLKTASGTVEAKVELRIIYTQEGKQRIRTLPAAFSSVKVIK
ncbi:hypothetical protein [Spirochaeta africana]|uniref:Uncharacterized protein n=1 Tax=Spirochaeta africana (strain ATCC 700263 / DSM 8902 / Z-7692) TaxID=889378 RepID=H9UFC4_SPIAZ|nr:hypothetical protein [Spirochaeta africana]AFG36217.1 hypothetical protein Spiaf_0108 [Spirochaeta africana DSM 8902]